MVSIHLPSSHFRSSCTRNSTPGHSLGPEIRFRFKTRPCHLQGQGTQLKEQEHSGDPSLSSTSITCWEDANRGTRLALGFLIGDTGLAKPAMAT